MIISVSGNFLARPKLMFPEPQPTSSTLFIVPEKGRVSDTFCIATRGPIAFRQSPDFHDNVMFLYQINPFECTSWQPQGVLFPDTILKRNGPMNMYFKFDQHLMNTVGGVGFKPKVYERRRRQARLYRTSSLQHLAQVSSY